MVILGGVKVVDKILFIENLFDKVDDMIIGGGMVYIFVKVFYNMEIGKFFFDEDGFKIINKICDKVKEKGVKIYLLIDFVVVSKFVDDVDIVSAIFEFGIFVDWMGLDIGLESFKIF